MKRIRFSRHALSYLQRRGFTQEEVIEAIRTCRWEEAEAGRRECRKDFPLAEEWNGKYNQNKQVRPIFIEEETEILMITVYTYYF